MEDVKSLIDLISRNKIKHIELIGPFQNSNSLYQTIYMMELLIESLQRMKKLQISFI